MRTIEFIPKISLEQQKTSTSMSIVSMVKKIVVVVSSGLLGSASAKRLTPLGFYTSVLSPSSKLGGIELFRTDFLREIGAGISGSCVIDMCLACKYWTRIYIMLSNCSNSLSTVSLSRITGFRYKTSAVEL